MFGLELSFIFSKSLKLSYEKYFLETLRSPKKLQKVSPSDPMISREILAEDSISFSLKKSSTQINRQNILVLQDKYNYTSYFNFSKLLKIMYNHLIFGEYRVLVRICKNLIFYLSKPEFYDSCV